MNKLTKLLRSDKKDLLSIYFTAGYPRLTDTPMIIKTLEEAGADLIEIGMPYSDPMADGPTIQESSHQAIANGMTLELLFQQLSELKGQIDIPLVYMGYFNQIMQFGEQAFFKKCRTVGIDGLIIPDLPLLEYEQVYQSLLKELDLSISFLVTPQTSDDRIRAIDNLSTGFIYMVADNSITGTTQGISEKQIQYFERIQNIELKTPRLIGFGISDHQSFSTACNYSRGAIIGSAFIKALGEGKSLDASIGGFIRTIKRDNAKPIKRVVA